jgi:hypothetical protein
MLCPSVIYNPLADHDHEYMVPGFGYGALLSLAKHNPRLRVGLLCNSLVARRLITQSPLALAYKPEAQARKVPCPSMTHVSFADRTSVSPASG